MKLSLQISLTPLLMLLGTPAFGQEIPEIPQIDDAPQVAVVDPSPTEQPSNLPDLAIMGTVPIYWGEVADMDEILAGEGQAHWARAKIEQTHNLVPLDFLSAEALSDHQYLMLAQPRGFSGEENVALDEWVRAGGRALMFVDPMMTGHSRFGIGDRRRPQGIALLSPILAHWGLELTFDENQDQEVSSREFAGKPIPLQLYGKFERSSKDQNCQLNAGGVIAQCRLGAGFVLIVADAAMLNLDSFDASTSEALSHLLALSLG